MTVNYNTRIETIKKILDINGIPYFEKDGRVYADSMIMYTESFEEVEDVTDWTNWKLLSWLGY